MEEHFKIDLTLARSLLKDETTEPRDALPYTEEFERLRGLYVERSGTDIEAGALMRAFFNAGKRGGFGGRRRSSQHAPPMSDAQVVRIGRLLGADLAARASLVYTSRFESMYARYCREFGAMSKSAFWLGLDGVAKRATGEEWKLQLRKARESACLAVEVYNKPLITFKSQAFTTLMVVAWTSLLQAFFLRIGIAPVYPREEGQLLRYWELSSCLKAFYGSEDSPVRSNLAFFIGLRNEIEHHGSPELDVAVFGETQALVMNFEECLVALFGEEHALAEQLSLAVQFSRLRHSKQNEAMRSLQRPLDGDVREYIETYRSQLSTEMWNSLEYSYRVFLVPKIDSKEKRSEIAVEFVPFDASDPDDNAALQQVAGMIVEKNRDVANSGWMKPGKVCKEVNRMLRDEGVGVNLSPSSSHSKLAYFYGVRPRNGASRPEKTRSEFCRYDDAHGDYTYSQKWVEFLVEKVSDPVEFKKALGKS